MDMASFKYVVLSFLILRVHHSHATISSAKLERDILLQLQYAKQTLRQMGNQKQSFVDECKPHIMSQMSESVTNVEKFSVQGNYASAIAQVLEVQLKLQSCIAALPILNVPESRQMHYLGSSVMAHIETASDLLEKIFTKQGLSPAPAPAPVPVPAPAPAPAPAPDQMIGSNGTSLNETCHMDGTTCQFSSCGKGRDLITCATGFAFGVVGGARGEDYVVTSSDDDPVNPVPGTLRYGARLGGGERGGVWIRFERDMEIVLKQMLWIQSSTTIDGRGYNITITGRELVVGGASDVILHNFQINNVGESDTIHVFSGSKKVWIDHISTYDGKLGLVSVVQGATDVTISNSFLTNPNFNMLLGASDADTEDQAMRITVYRNWFKDSRQRMPHCRWGYFHVLNNLYTNWGYYAIGARVNAKVVSESNVFIAGRRGEITPWHRGTGPEFDDSASIRSFNDLMLNGSTFHQFEGQSPPVTFAPTHYYGSPALQPPVRPTSILANFVQSCSGALFGSRLYLCLLATKLPPFN